MTVFTRRKFVVKAFAAAALMCASAAFGEAQSAALALVSPTNGACVSLLTAKQRAFVAMDFDTRAAYFVDKTPKNREIKKWGTRPRPVCLEWKGTEGRTCDVTVRCRKGGAQVFHAQETTNRVNVWNLEIGAEYDWTVSCGGASASGGFSTSPTAPRFLRIDGVPNCRDLGGRRGLDGRRVRQGLVFRTAEFNRSTTERCPPPGAMTITAKGLEALVGQLGVKTDLDLRREDECLQMSGSPLGPDVKWLQIHASVLCYSNVVASTKGREQFVKIFRVFLDDANYPIVFHCRGGADRTGTVGMILNALLGVSEEDLWKDYQVTAMWGTVGDMRHFRLFTNLMRAFDKFPGATIRERVEAYVKSIGFTDADIASFRARMLEPAAP